MKRERDFRPIIPQGVQCYFGKVVNRRRKVESVLAEIVESSAGVVVNDSSFHVQHAEWGNYPARLREALQ